MDLVYVRHSSGIWKVGDSSHQIALKVFQKKNVVGPVMIHIEGEGEVKWWRLNSIVCQYESSIGERISVMKA